MSIIEYAMQRMEIGTETNYSSHKKKICYSDEYVFS